MPSPSASDAPISDWLALRKRAQLESAAAGEGAVTLTGIVEQGVEYRSIVLLENAGGAPLAQLVGQPSGAYPFGARVEVTGRFLPGLRTTAQQGRPFRVEVLKVG